MARPLTRLPEVAMGPKTYQALEEMKRRRWASVAFVVISFAINVLFGA